MRKIGRIRFGIGLVLLWLWATQLSAATYYLQSTGSAPWPFDPYDGEQPISVLDEAQHIYLVEDEGGSMGRRGMNMMSLDFPLPGGGGTNGSYITYTNTFSFDTNGLWLELTNVNAATASGWLHHATNYVYLLQSKETLDQSGWQMETEVFPSDTNAEPFSVNRQGRDILFLQAMDWTGVDADADGLPDWWEWYWFASLAYSGTDTDGNGNTLLYDYQNNLDPNPIQFTLKTASRYVAGGYPNLQVNVTTGTPFYYTVQLDNTNFMAATDWQPYSSSNLTISLGSMEGWHGVWVGLKGYAPESVPVWQWKRLKLDTIPPQITITNATTVDAPVLQLQGFSDEALSHISYDLTNALGLVTNQDVGVESRFDDAPNGFHAYDVELTNGINIITIHAVDKAGNETATNFTFTLDYSSKTNPPTIQLFWPQDKEQISGSNFTWRGWVSDPTAGVVATLVDANGTTNMVNGVVERNGNFWVEHLPMPNGTNQLILAVTDAAGNVNTTNITVSPCPFTVTMTPIADEHLWDKTVTATGTISDSSQSLWINGVKATVSSGVWTAINVPMTEGGVATFKITCYEPGELQPDGSHGN